LGKKREEKKSSKPLEEKVNGIRKRFGSFVERRRK